MNEWLKKSWKFITGIVLGILSIISFNKLGLFRKSKSGDEFDEQHVDELRQSVESSIEQVSDIRDTDSDVRESVRNTIEQVEEIRDNDTSIRATSEELGNSIQRVQDLIKAERERIRKSEELE